MNKTKLEDLECSKTFDWWCTSIFVQQHNENTLSPLKMLEEKNVKFFMSNQVTEIRGKNGKVIIVSDGW